MAKDTRQVLRGVVIDGVVYGEEQADEIASKLKPQDLKRLQQNGTLAGEWGTEAPASHPPEGDAEPAPKPALTRSRTNA